MKVARLHGVGDLRLHDESPPRPAPGEVLVRVDAVGICGSDLHWFGEGGIGDAQLGAPLVIGHEIAGTVEDGPLAGQLVAVDPAIPCGVCDTCVRGLHHLCPTVRFSGHGGVDGGLRDDDGLADDFAAPASIATDGGGRGDARTAWRGDPRP